MNLSVFYVFLAITITASYGQFNKTSIEMYYRREHRANGLPICVSANEGQAQRCALEKSGIENIQDIDKNDFDRGCCFNWNMLNCWDELNGQECSREKYEIWQKAMQIQIQDFEKYPCADHKYRTGFSKCGTSTVLASMVLSVISLIFIKIST